MLLKKYILGAVLASNFVLPAVQENITLPSTYARVSQVNEDTIAKHKEAIAKELQLNSAVQLFSKGAAGIAATAACLMWFNDISFVTGDELRTMRRCTGVIKAIAESEAFQHNPAVRDALIGATQPASGWGRTFGTLLGNMALTMTLQHFVLKYIAKIFHEQTISWYVQEKTLLATLAEQISVLQPEIDVLKLGKALVTRESCDTYVTTIVEMHNNLAEQVEQIVGYMRYCIEAASEKSSRIIKEKNIGSALLSRVSFAAGALKSSLDDYNQASSDDQRILAICSMFDTVQQLMRQVTSSIKQFKFVEQKMQQA